MGRWCPTFGGWCAGSCCVSRVRFVLAVLFPSFWTVIPRGRWVRLLSGSLTLCGWGSSPLLSARVPHVLCWWRFHLLWRFQTAFVGLLTFICLGRVRVVVAPRGRMLPLGGVRVFPVYLRSGRCRCCCVRVGNARSPVGDGVVSVRGGAGAYAVSGCPVTVPVGCGCGVSLFLAHGAVYRGCACALVCIRLALCVACVGACCCASMRHCLSAVSCSVACCWFVAVCFACRLLYGVRFVSAPAPTVTWFMLVGACAHLTAAVVVAYCLLCKWAFLVACAAGCARIDNEGEESLEVPCYCCGSCW